MAFIEKVKASEVDEKTQIEPFVNNIAVEFEDLSREDLNPRNLFL